MTVEELGAILRDSYNNAPKKKSVTFIHLFGIQYHERIKELGTREVVEASGINETYHAEVNKGIRLAEYVTLKKPLNS